MAHFLISLQESKQNFDVSFGEIQYLGTPTEEVYEGSYSVIPRETQQILLTRKKYMKDNLTIQKIPYYDVSNSSGGSTVYIAEELKE